MPRPTPDILKKMTDEHRADPPKGLIVHTASQVGDKIRVIDVWESRAALDRFQDRLRATFDAVAQREGLQVRIPPIEEAYEAFDILVRPQ